MHIGFFWFQYCRMSLVREFGAHHVEQFHHRTEVNMFVQMYDTVQLYWHFLVRDRLLNPNYRRFHMQHLSACTSVPNTSRSRPPLQVESVTHVGSQ